MGYLFRAYSTKELDKFIGEYYYQATTFFASNADPNHVVDVERTDRSSLPISRTQGTGFGMRREWRHIRAQQSSVYVLWFPRHGPISITQDRHVRAITNVGQFAITYGDRPFDIRTQADSEGRSRHMQVAIPSHILRSRLPLVDKLCGRPISGERGLPLISKEIFLQLIEHGDMLSPAIAESLSFTALDSLIESVQNVTRSLRHSSAWQIHLDRAIAFIDDNFPDSDITGSQIAAACGFSRRYLHYLLKCGNLSLKEYLMCKRLALAADHLRDPNFDCFTMSDIAFAVGFKNPDLFQTAFFRIYGDAPDRQSVGAKRQLVGAAA